MNLTAYLTTTDVAQSLKCSVSTLKRWRRGAQGPHWVQIGSRSVRYPVADLEAWMSRRDVAAPSRAVSQREADRLLTLEEAAVLALVAVPTIEQWIAAGMPVVSTDKLFVFVSDLQERLGRVVTPTGPAAFIIPAGMPKNEVPDDNA